MGGSLDGWKYAWMKAWMDGGEIHYLGEASHTELKDSCRVLVSTYWVLPVIRAAEVSHACKMIKHGSVANGPTLGLHHGLIQET